ncbi:MAG: SDR family oxidoreductase [Paludibacterium sp.]|uniref:SDR family oxidoreductase n=1 Tax=Paludibacterium sp. TaxID=1917523 RepID=UPI0025D0FB7D|nr:SDR family oxidoreductase [Paludibacterium sp.]MBV8047909.1 SDR family oxidoreductase [Paludibacterium sp.]MBV8647661.1 SDR family oxidoreductase [Paludibacterium sp.]
MQINHSVAFVTGANRGLGLALVHELLARGASKVYAGMRTPVDLGLAGVITVPLDVTKPDQIAAAVRQCADTTLLINNAGIAEVADSLAPDGIETSRRIFETNYYGLIGASQAFAPVLAAHGGGAIVNVLSVVSWVSSSMLTYYAASKSAAWSYTNALRLQLQEQGTQVVGLHVGFMETDLTKGFLVDKIDPRLVAARTLDGIEAGAEEVLADEVSAQVKQGLVAEPAVYLRPLVR